MRLTTTILAAAIATAGSTTKAEPPTIIELYTSLGCNSCPPADALLAELAQREDVVALSLHVDYWDYLGWADPFAAPEHARRQKKLAKLRGERMVYTPQMVIDGRVAVVGSDHAGVAAAVALAQGHAHAAEVSFAAEGEEVVARIDAPEPVEVELTYMIYDHPREVTVRGGENEGLSISYVNVVRGMMPLGAWSGRQGEWRLPLPSDAKGAVLILQDRSGAVVGVARYEGDAR
jgi:hypothetical protein